MADTEVETSSACPGANQSRWADCGMADHASNQSLTRPSREYANPLGPYPLGLRASTLTTVASAGTNVQRRALRAASEPGLSPASPPHPEGAHQTSAFPQKRASV